MKHNITLYVFPTVSQYMSALLQSFQNQTAFVCLSLWLTTCYYWLYLQKTEYAMHKFRLNRHRILTSEKETDMYFDFMVFIHCFTENKLPVWVPVFTYVENTQ